MNTRLLTLKQVRERLGVGKWTLQRLINEDPDFKTIKMGHRRMMREAALEEYIHAKEAA